jgi:phosphoribosylanthranilate isomerase
VSADTLVKICGLSTPDAVEAALDGGATHLGFVFFPKSPRDIDPADGGRAGRHGARARRCPWPWWSIPTTPCWTGSGEVAPDLYQLHGRETPSAWPRSAPAPARA